MFDILLSVWRAFSRKLSRALNVFDPSRFIVIGYIFFFQNHQPTFSNSKGPPVITNIRAPPSRPSLYDWSVLFYPLTLLFIMAWAACDFLVLMDCISWPTASNLFFIQSRVIGASGGYDTFTFFATSVTSWSFSEQLSNSAELCWHLKKLNMFRCRQEKTSTG